MSSEICTSGQTRPALSIMESRSLDSHAAFLKPHLRHGMKIMDCGCGTGSIDVGLAKIVAPGKVYAIDIEESEISQARELAVHEQAHVEYQVADVYKLPFEENGFDGAFAHALFEQLKKPLDALKEISRVVKFGGFVALRSPDWGGFVLEPWNVQIAQALDAYIEIQSKRGIDVHSGRKLAGYMRKSGLGKIEASASYEIYPAAPLIAEYLASQLDQSGETEASKNIRQWAKHPDAMLAQAWFEAIAFKL